MFTPKKPRVFLAGIIAGTFLVAAIHILDLTRLPDPPIPDFITIEFMGPPIHSKKGIRHVLTRQPPDPITLPPNHAVIKRSEVKVETFLMPHTPAIHPDYFFRSIPRMKFEPDKLPPETKKRR